MMSDLRDCENWTQYKLDQTASSASNGLPPENDPSKSEHKFLGVTPPISTDLPQPLDIQKSTDLLELLKRFDQFETKEEVSHRMKVVGQINVLLHEWAKGIALKKKVPSDIVDKGGCGRLYVFGSYRLGVHTNETDIDALCLGARYVERKDFFTTFANLLRIQPDVQNLRCIEEALVPVIKLNFDGIEVDLAFASLPLREIPETQELSDINLFRNLDMRCVRSLNGVRCTDEIASLVPNLENFQLTLRCIKLWAKKHSIDSNVLGFAGGISWAILVARTCQLYPNASPATLVQKFFFIFAQWPWPKPVLLKDTERNVLKMTVWDPRIHISDRAHLMPIITPCYPEQNSTVNISLSTKIIIQRELQEGLEIMTEIMNEKSVWAKLFEVPVFFEKYKHFIFLVASSGTEEHHTEWIGAIKLKLRTLVADFEKNKYINLAHVNPEIFPTLEHIPNRFQSQFVIGLEFKEMKNISINITQQLSKFTADVTNQAKTTKIFKESMKIEAQHVRQNDLKTYLPSSLLTKRQQKCLKLL